MSDPNREPADPAALAALELLCQRATPAPWFTVGAPWLPAAAATYIIAGHEDPHVGRLVCDFDFVEDREQEDRSDQDAELIVMLRNSARALIAAARQAARLEGDTDHPEHKCQRCGGKNITWYADADLWNRYGDGVLCPLCFVRAAEAGGVKTCGWRLAPAGEAEEKIKRLRAALLACDVVMDTAATHGLPQQLPPAYRDSWAAAHVGARRVLSGDPDAKT